MYTKFYPLVQTLEKKNFILMSVGKNLKRHMFQYFSFANLLVDLQQWTFSLSTSFIGFNLEKEVVKNCLVWALQTSDSYFFP